LTSFLKDNISDAFLLLNGISGIGPITAKNLLSVFKGNPCAVFEASERELITIPGVGKKIISSIKNPNNYEWLQSEKEKIKQRNATFLIQSDLPDFLLQIYDPPIGLYVSGTIPDRPCFGIVGTRIPTMYGIKQSKKLAYDLTKAGFCIVSGMARGIDTSAHEGALDAGGPTLAFLGSGLDIIYPPENLTLYKRIMENGAVVSEFPFGRRADRTTFPMRNRLVSGISQGVVVVESADSGGSLITAQFCAEQGRSVFAIPGRVDQPSSAGCHKIIREGATLITSARDIIEDLRPCLDTIQTNLDLDDGENSSLANNFNQLHDFGPNEKLLLKVLSEGELLSFDELSKRTSLSVSEAMSALSLLELNRVIKKHINGKFEIS